MRITIIKLELLLLHTSFAAAVVVGYSTVKNLSYGDDSSLRSSSTSTSTSASASASASVRSVGELIQRATTLRDLLDASEKLWLPTDHDLAPHLKQRVHQEKRLRWSSQLIYKMGSLVQERQQNQQECELFWEDARLERAILAAAIPFATDNISDSSNQNNDHLEKEGRCLKEALYGLHNLIGSQAVGGAVTIQIFNGIQTMFERIDSLCHLVPFSDAIEMKWACRSISSRLTRLSSFPSDVPLKVPLTLEARTALLPFDILPDALDWEQIVPDAFGRLQREIPFAFDTIVTRSGAAVTERRGTAWIAEQGVGSLAYSGKLMAPSPVPPLIRQIMRHVEMHVLPNDESEGRESYPRPFFDCALCNFYPNAESACKFHTDPEHGSHWERLTCVVAVGDPRRFAFRPIPKVSTWSNWENVKAKSLRLASADHHDPNVPATITLFSGDVVKMFGACNDDFHHAVYPAANESSQQSAGAGDSNIIGQRGRISLVLKRAINRNGGQKGHGIAGRGRRARSRKTAVGATAPSSARTTGPRSAPSNNARRRRR